MTKLLTLLLLCCSSPAFCQDSLLTVFWNVENFFDYRSENAPRFWNKKRFYTKCDAIAKVLLRIADEKGSYPDIVGFAEVENKRAVRALLSSTLLRKLGYECIHYDSFDHRGIDCALIYRKEKLNLLGSAPKHIYDTTGAIIATRDILLAEFLTTSGAKLAVLLNHHPSKIGGKTDRRDAAMARMGVLVDSLLFEACPAVLAMGDFNESLWPGNEHKTYKYNGKWDKIDGYFSFGGIQVKEEVFTDRLLMEKDKMFGGEKPRRCFIGPRYNGGISDHLPLVLSVYIREESCE